MKRDYFIVGDKVLVKFSSQSKDLIGKVVKVVRISSQGDVFIEGGKSSFHKQRALDCLELQVPYHEDTRDYLEAISDAGRSV